MRRRRWHGGMRPAVGTAREPFEAKPPVGFGVVEKHCHHFDLTMVRWTHRFGLWRLLNHLGSARIMLIGYVSDERYAALADVLLEFTNDQDRSFEARSRASGSVHGDLPAGDYLVTLQKCGFGSKRVRLTMPAAQPHHFRLLADGLLGYAWPRCVRAGDTAEFRVHAVEPYKLELWRYGWTKEFVRGLGWHDEHGPRATMQVTPDGDYTQTGVEWNKVGYL